MKNTLQIIAALAALAPSVAGAQAAGTAADRIARIEKDIRPMPVVRGNATTIDARMNALKVPAVSIAVVDSGRIVWTKAYGVADVGSRQPATTATRFQAASMSKPVASTAALRLVEEGKLSLDTDVNAALRSWKVPPTSYTAQTPVTLRMLLTHTAGLTVHGFPGYAAGAAIPSVPQILDGTGPANTPAVRVDVAPGTIWRYSGGGMTVAQLLMTDVTGESFPALVRRLVLAPAGMTSSGYEQPLPDSVAHFGATAHRTAGTVLPGRWHAYPEMMAAGLWTTATDLARYIIEIQNAYAGNSRVLSQTMAQAMLTPGLGNWGLGIQIAGVGDSARFTHGGSNAGFRGQFIGYVTGGRGVVVLTNGDAGGALANEIIGAVGREYDWPGLRALREYAEIAIDPQLLDDTSAGISSRRTSSSPSPGRAISSPRSRPAESSFRSFLKETASSLRRRSTCRFASRQIRRGRSSQSALSRAARAGARLASASSESGLIEKMP